MECKKPILVGKVRHKQRLVPCGKCAQCKANLRAEWCGRLAVEDFYCMRSYFVTLTYSDENLRLTDLGVPSVWKDDVQRFIKRFRKKYSLRYFCTAEYGSKTMRPHYHIIFFLSDNIDIAEFGNLIDDTWKLGRSHIGDVSPASIAYCTKYCMKDNKGYPTGSNPPFRLMSKVPALGCQIILDNSSLGSFNWYGQTFKTARLFRDKFYNNCIDLGEQLKALSDQRQVQRIQARFAAWCRLNNKDVHDTNSRIEFKLWLDERNLRKHELSLKHIKEETL